MGSQVGVADVARRAGVSLGTVSNVLNHPDRVAAPTLSRVRAAIADLGFVRNEAARMLRTGRSRTIGLVVLDVANPFFTDIAVGVEDAAETAGLTVVMCNSGEDSAREARHLAALEEQRSFGILLAPSGDRTPQVQDIRRRGIPVVLVDRGSDDGLCSVSVDDVAGGRMAVEHLLDQGHQRIGFVGGPLRTTQVGDRLRGARLALRAAGGRPAGFGLTVFETAMENIASGRGVGDLVAETTPADRPTAVFCANDLLALGLMTQVQRRRLRVPEDIAIVGYDDIELAADAAVSLSSVRQPSRDLGRAATELLVDEVSAGAAHRHRQVVFSPELVVRDSSVRDSSVRLSARRVSARRRRP